MRITIQSILIVFALCLCSGCNRPSDYDECVLKYVKEDMNEMAVNAVVASCENKFPYDDSSQSSESLERSLNSNELSNLTGRAGLKYGSTFGGDIYNGNSDIMVTEVVVAVTTTSGGEEVTRKYKDDVLILPNATWPFSFDIIVGDRGADYSWFILAAKAKPTTSGDG